MMPYDLYLVQKHLDPKFQNISKPSDSFQNIPNSKNNIVTGNVLRKETYRLPANSFTCTPRFDIVNSISNWPEALELIIQHLGLKDIVHAQQVCKAWSTLFHQEHMYRRLMLTFYPSRNSFGEISKDIIYLSKDILCCTNKKWLQLLMQHYYLIKDLAINPHAIQHTRLLNENHLSQQVSHDPIFFLQRFRPGSLIGLVKKSSGAQIIRWDNTIFLNQDDFSYTLDTPLVGGILSISTKFDIAYCPSALVTDPDYNWVAFSTYLRHDSGPKIYSLTDKQLIWDPRSSLNDPTTGAIISLVSFKIESKESCITCCYLAAGTADGRVFIWWIPSKFTKSEHNGFGPKLISIISVAGPRVPILGLHYIYPGKLIVVSRLGNVYAFDLHLKNNSNEHHILISQRLDSTNPDYNMISQFNSDFEHLLNVITICSYELPSNKSLENDIIQKFSFRGTNIVLTSFTTLFHLVVVQSSITNRFSVNLLYTSLLPCQPSSIEMTLQPFAGLNPDDLSIKPVHIHDKCSSYSRHPICIYGIWCTNLRPNPGHSLYIMNPFTLLWKGVKGSLYSGQGMFTSSSIMTPDQLALGGRDGCLHVIRFPVSPRHP